MELIYEKYDFSFRLFNFIYHSFESLFKLTTIACSCDKSREIECTNLSILEYLWNFSKSNFSSNSLNDGCLSYTRISDEDWIIFGTP